MEKKCGKMYTITHGNSKLFPGKWQKFWAIFVYTVLRCQHNIHVIQNYVLRVNPTLAQSMYYLYLY